MTLMKIPNWLSKRRVCCDDPSELKKLLPRKENFHFSDITVTAMQNFYHHNPRSVFYKLIRILGFYGVKFDGKLTSFSGPLDKFPDVLCVAITHWHHKLSNYLIDINIYSLFQSCGIHILKQLHGIPVESITKISGQTLTYYNILSILPVTITKAHKDFFIYDPSSAKENSESGKTVDVYYTTINQPDEQLSRHIEDLNLSIRPLHYLRKNKIYLLGELLQKTENELLSIPHFGEKSLTEIKTKLLLLFPNLQCRLIPRSEIITQAYEVNLNSEDIMSKLTISTKDLILSHRTKKCLEKMNIKYVWQLIQMPERNLLKIKNLGRKSLNEIKNIIGDLGFKLGVCFTSEQIEKIRDYEQVIDKSFLNKWLKVIANELLDHPLNFLNYRQKRIVRERIWKDGTKHTLEEIATDFGVTRERVRQLEKSACKKIKQQYSRELREAVKCLKQQIEKLGGLASFEDLDVDLIGFSSQEQAITISLINLIENHIYIDWEFSLISSHGEDWILDIMNKVQKVIQEHDNGPFFSMLELELAVKTVTSKYGIFANQNYQNFIKKFFNKKNVTKSEGLLCFGKLLKHDKLSLAFKEYYPRGIEIYKKQDEILQCLKKYDFHMFQDATHRAIIAGLNNHPDILLWDRGFLIHRENVKPDMNVVTKIADWILSTFEKGISRFQIDLPYSKFNKELDRGDVPNRYALYTSLRLLEIKRIGLRKFPTIVDIEADVDLKEGILEELESYFYDKKVAIPYSQVKEEFINKRGWKEYSLQQNSTSHSELIYPWKDQSYIHLEYLFVSYDKLEELIGYLREKLLTINGSYSLKGCKAEMNVLWEQVCPNATVRTMIKLIRSVVPEDLQIDHYFIKFSEKSSESISAAVELEEHFLENGSELSKYDLREEFCVNRGWTENQLYSAIHKANLFKSGKNTYVHPNTIKWNQSLSQQVHRILERFLRERNKKRQPYMQIDELIYKYVLPELPNDIQWTRHLIKSVGTEIGDFLFFDDAYTFLDNDFGIEDLDDMIGFIISRFYKLGIAKKEKVEKLLWREGILESGHSIPSNQFFNESSILYIEASDEVGLSPIGITKYGRSI